MTETQQKLELNKKRNEFMENLRNRKYTIPDFYNTISTLIYAKEPQNEQDEFIGKVRQIIKETGQE